MRIRNGIVALWRKQQPLYLTKTMARKQIKAAGDVNAIGRVHDFLERFGVINVGAVTLSKMPRPAVPAPAAPRPPKPAAAPRPRSTPTDAAAPTGLARYGHARGQREARWHADGR